MAPKTTLAISLVASAALLGSVAVAQSRAGGERTFTVAMTGAAEAPGPGDPDGTGTATFTVSVPQKEICYELEVSGIEPATAAHIHLAPPGSPGPVVVPLDAPTDGTSEGCADVTARLAAQIMARPQRYYVNVHNTPHPGGAVRGQLG